MNMKMSLFAEFQAGIDQGASLFLFLFIYFYFIIFFENGDTIFYSDGTISHSLQ